MNCVCGCDQRLHRQVTMSVPLLPNPNPIYPIEPHKNALVSFVNRPGVNYEHDECRCGCCQYEEYAE